MNDPAALLMGIGGLLAGVGAMGILWAVTRGRHVCKPAKPPYVICRSCQKAFKPPRIAPPIGYMTPLTRVDIPPVPILPMIPHIEPDPRLFGRYR